MEEIFKALEPPFESYKVSNYGRILNRNKKEIKPDLGQYKNTIYPKVNINIRRNGRSQYRKVESLAVAVYRLFGEGYSPRAIVYHRDGNHMNCRIDNLYIASGYTVPPNENQIQTYEESVIKCVLHYVGIKRINRMGDLVDVDNIIGESYLMIWKHLSQYKDGTSFYQFCRRYVEWAFLSEYKLKKKERARIDTNVII